MEKIFIHKNNCRICGSKKLINVFNLGNMPLANNFLKKEKLKNPELKFPLAVYFCKDCNLLQIIDIVNPKILFGNYYYQTSTSKPLVEHFVKFGNALVKRFIKKKEDLFVDIGGNDGVLLHNIKKKCSVLNIEPAKNIAKMSESKGVETICDFFSADSAKKIIKKYGFAKVVTASNVFAHVDNLDDFLKGIEILIGDEGVFVFEVHWVANLLGLSGIGGFDQIYHEHLSYFSLRALKKLVDRFGLKIFDVKLIPIHGQSLQIYIAKNYEVSEKVERFLQKEKSLGLYDSQTYLDFDRRVKKNKKELRDLLLKLKEENKRIVGYGAPAKGNILLNYFQIDNKILDFIVDDSSFKQGLYTPGTHIPIYSPDRFKKYQPDYLLLLAWNYAESIFKKEQKLKNKGVKFIIPVPKVKII